MRKDREEKNEWRLKSCYGKKNKTLPLMSYHLNKRQVVAPVDPT